MTLRNQFEELATKSQQDAILDGKYIIELGWTGGKIEYIGRALPGSATSSAIWQIRKVSWSGDNLTSIKYANGSTTFDQIWDNRGALSYG